MNSSVLLKKLLFLIIAFVVTTAHAQDKSAAIKSMLDKKRFVFKAQTVLPTSMALRHLTGDNYNLSVSGDSLVSYLPYFGRAYSAPSPGANAGYNFTSKDFDYTTTTRKKGGWEVIIKPNDVKDVREFSLIVTKSGNATLRALSNNRQMISYDGYLAETGK